MKHILTLVKKLMKKILNLKLVILIEYQNIKIFLAKGYSPNWSEDVFMIKKAQILCRGHTLLVLLTRKKFLELFTKKNCKEQIKKSLELKK